MSTSTVQSYIDSATGAAQSVLGSITGNSSTEAKGDLKQNKADVENAASHTTGKLGPFTVTAEGGLAKDDPRRQEGAWNQTVGAAKEAVGGLIGHEGLKREGQEQNAAGKGQEAAGQLSDLSSGAGNRAAGYVNNVVAGLTGDREAQVAAQKQHDDGKAMQRGAEVDIQKNA